MKLATRGIARRAAAAAVALAMPFAISAAVAPTASAATCASNYVCLWSGTNYTGTYTSVLVGQGLGCFPMPIKRSGINRGTVVDVWSGSGCTGSHQSLGSSANFGFDAVSLSVCFVCKPA